MIYSTPIHLITQHYPQIQAIYVFGSFVSGDISSQSDVDIALLCLLK